MRGSFDFIFTLWLNTAELVKGGGDVCWPVCERVYNC